MLLESLVFIGSFIMCFAPNLGVFIGGRVFVGAGTRMCLPSGSTLINELVYTNIRGRLMSFWQMFFSVGALLASYISLGGTYSPQLGLWQWRMAVIIQVINPIIICSTIFLVPETPRWYMQHDREADARRSLEKVRRPEEIDQELFEIREAIIYENTYTKGSYKQLFVNKSYRNRLILAVIINAGQQFTGVGTLTSYSGIIYKQVFSSTNTVILINALNSVTSIMFCFITFFVADRWGRMPLLMYGALGQGCMMLGVATLVTQSKVVNGMRSIGIGAGTAVFFFIFHLFYQPSWGATIWIWTTEIFPMAC